ncbi:MAG: phage tail protein [Allosphingosinicella sp.]|uniref:phage tail protein n=1 Tax=Allosphingosinicella sp. TaxID=2823234 RepID=UPI00394A5673
MAEPFLSEIRMMSFNFAPKGWALCNGQFLPINQNQALFALLGTTYGGNGQTTFALPDMRGRVPVHFGNEYTLGQKGGQTSHTLTMQEMPQHIHVLSATNTGTNTNQTVGNTFTAFGNGYRPPDSLTALSPSTVTSVGGNQPHENRQPFTAINFAIALQGIFPSRN